MDRFAAVLIVIVTALHLQSAWAADPSPARPHAAKSMEMFPPLKSGVDDGQTPTAEQIQVNYATDRKLHEVQVRLNGNDADGALALLDEVVADFRTAGLFDDRLDFHARFWYALIHESRKKPEEVDAAFEQAMKLAERAYGVISREAAAPRIRWGLAILRQEGNLDRAQKAFEEALAIHRKLGDPYDVDSLKSLEGVGSCEIKRHRAPEAIACLREVCDRRRERHFDDFKPRGKALHYLGVAYYLAGDFPAARASFDESAECYEKLQGPAGADVQEARELSLQSAQATTRQGEVARAELELKSLEKQYQEHVAAKNRREALAIAIRQGKILRASAGSVDEETLTIFYRAANLHDELGEFEQAATKFAEVLALAERWSACPPAIVGRTAFRLGVVELKLSRFVAAGRSLRRADEYYVGLKTDKYHLWSIRKGLAAVEVAAKNYKAALDHAEAWAALVPPGNEAAARSSLISSSRVACFCYGDEALRDRCRAMLAMARTEAVAKYGERDPVYAEILASLAHFQYRDSDRACVESAAAALAIQKSLLPETDEKVLDLEIALAKMCRGFDEVERARTILEAAIAKLRNSEEPNARLLWRALYWLAGIDAHQGRKSEAEARYRESIALATKLYGADDEAVVLARELLDDYLAGRLPSLKPDNPEIFDVNVSVAN